MKLDKTLIPSVIEQVNHYLRGERHEQLAESNIAGAEWLECLARTKRPENTDGKSLGTCIERLLKAELSRVLRMPLTGNAASGVDIVELCLNTKATSDKQPQSSEPFDSPYERVLGAKFDIFACIYNGIEFLQPQKQSSLQITAAMYYDRTEVADQRLCKTARFLQSAVNDGVMDEQLGKRVLRAIVYAKKTAAGFKILSNGLERREPVVVQEAVEVYEEKMLEKVEIKLPSVSEWETFKGAPLNGKISISFALQWRYQYNPDVEGIRYF